MLGCARHTSPRMSPIRAVGPDGAWCFCLADEFVGLPGGNGKRVRVLTFGEGQSVFHGLVPLVWVSISLLYRYSGYHTIHG